MPRVEVREAGAQIHLCSFPGGAASAQSGGAIRREEGPKTCLRVRRARRGSAADPLPGEAFQCHGFLKLKLTFFITFFSYF